MAQKTVVTEKPAGMAQKTVVTAICDLPEDGEVKGLELVSFAFDGSHARSTSPVLRIKELPEKVKELRFGAQLVADCTVTTATREEGGDNDAEETPTCVSQSYRLDSLDPADLVGGQRHHMVLVR